ncbi:MAG TPA: hypothetical protein DCQ84_02620 [Candidatus Competibacteraceae bacterium]|nr:hypothetical protein [Candidatus Competibacteraceae bacterium]
MSAAPKLDTAADPFATVRALNRMRAAGFALSLDDDRLMVEPLSRLSEQHRALIEAGAAGLAWREGTPADWTDDRLLAAGEALYADGRMAKRHERRYRPTSAPAIEEGPEYCPAAEVVENLAPMGVIPTNPFPPRARWQPAE